MTPPARAPLGAALALLLALASLCGGAASAIVAVVAVALVLLVAAGWPVLLELPSALGTRIVMAATGLVGVLAALSPPAALSPMASIASVCALGVFASFVHQMLRRRRSELTASLTGTVAGVVLTGLVGCWVQAVRAVETDGASLAAVTACAVALAAALVVLEAPLPAPLAAGGAVVVATAVALLVLVTGPGGASALLAIAAGAMSGVAAAASHRLLASLLVARDPLPSLAVAATPVATAGVIVLLAARLLG